MLYANLSQQLHTIKSNLKVLHGQNHRNHSTEKLQYRVVAEVKIFQKCFLSDPARKILTKEGKETFQVQMFELIKLLSL